MSLIVHNIWWVATRPETLQPSLRFGRKDDTYMNGLWSRKWSWWCLWCEDGTQLRNTLKVLDPILDDQLLGVSHKIDAVYNMVDVLVWRRSAAQVSSRWIRKHVKGHERREQKHRGTIRFVHHQLLTCKIRQSLTLKLSRDRVIMVRLFGTQMCQMQGGDGQHLKEEERTRKPNPYHRPPPRFRNFRIVAQRGVSVRYEMMQ
jgi:hypothetical protein